MEPDALILGNEPYAALVNCRPTEYPDYNKVPVARYHKAMDKLELGPKAGPEYCAQVMESMAACRGRLGEGTLYTTIYDLEKKAIQVYFYHDFSTSVTFDLQEELTKGEHKVSLPELFPENQEYMALLTYKTPFNSDFVRLGLIALLFIISILSLILMYKSVSKHLKGVLDHILSSYLTLFIILSLNLLAAIHLVILLIIQPVFYFGLMGQLANFPITQVVYSPIVIAIGTMGLLMWWGFKSIKKQSSKTVELPLKLNICILSLLSLMNIYWHLMIP
jgi:hypothetical protein